MDFSLETQSSLKRKFLGKELHSLPLQDLIQAQLKSYENFLQRYQDPHERDPSIGLESLLKSYFPIESPNKDLILEYLWYSFGEVKVSEEIAKRNNLTYSIVFKVMFRLVNTATGELREKELYMGDIPLMTNRGTFIINGAERVVVNQIHKSPGIFFNKDEKELVYSARIVPDRGTWIEFEINAQKDLFYVKVDRKKGILITTFLRILGYEKDEDIVRLFYPVLEVNLLDPEQKIDILENSEYQIRLAENIMDFKVGQELISQDFEKILTFGNEKITIIDPKAIQKNKVILNCLDIDDTEDREQAVFRFFTYFKSADPNIVDNMKVKDFDKIFFDTKFYNLGVGRYKINQKLYSINDEKPVETTMVNEDIVRTVRYLLDLYEGGRFIDDIDHLGNRRIRSVDELLVNQLRIAFARIEKNIKERMLLEDINELTPQKLVSIKPLMVSIKEFFGTNQLSQFMDQTNPLSELTHKRRLNALGPGGLTRDRAGFEVRDVHYTHYGRICPIETPEGPNIGLILSLANYAKVNEYGFLVTPYWKVVQGRLTKDLDYLTALEEDQFYIAKRAVKVDDQGYLQGDLVVARRRGEFHLVSPEKVDYIDVSNFQIVGVSTSLIPFLDHDDANRALMGANMQRQAVPLMITDSPYVGTGIEWKAAYDSRVCVIAKNDGKVKSVSSVCIELELSDGAVDTYPLIKYQKTNQNTVSNQIPLVYEGDLIKKGDLIADGAACQNGELALGKNLVVAFMSFEGYNFEDAIILSERLVKEDVLTSLHIEEFQIDVRETKMGKEKITRDIPNISQEYLLNLDDNGIVKVGAWVLPNSILVGKITPKAEVESTPEYKLLHSIFGEKAREVKDSSLYYPSGVSPGIVVEVTTLRRDEGYDMAPGVEMIIKVCILQKRKIAVGDKMAGRHGNKGVVSRIVPEEDMPFLEDGTPIDIVLNPLSLPSRMNIGQLLETKVGWISRYMKEKIAVPIFSDIKDADLRQELRKMSLDPDGKVTLYDGKTGEAFLHKVTVGVIYMLKLNHMIDDKIHARSTGPYSLVTQQPLGGKAQTGGQRLGEMEVWALEAYGAAYTLQEFLTVKADDMEGRTKIYENIIRNRFKQAAGITESFNVLIQELRGLGLDINIYDEDKNLLALTDKDVENLNKKQNKNES